MVGTHQLVVALSPPTQDQLTETLSLELSRSQLFCLLSVIGEQASNIGKELLERWRKQSVLSSEVVYQVLTEYTQVALETKTRISCAVIVFRGSRTTIATLRAGVSLRRDSLEKVVVKASEGVEIREGSSQAHDLYFLHTELAGRQAEELLIQSKFPDQLLKQWQVCQTEVVDIAAGSVGLAVGLVLPNSLLETQAGRGFLMIDNGLRTGELTELEGISRGKSTETNLLQQRRASRKQAESWRQRLSMTVGLITAKLLRKSKKTDVGSIDTTTGEKSPDLNTEEAVDRQSLGVGSNIVDQDKGAPTTRATSMAPVDSLSSLSASPSVTANQLKSTQRDQVSSLPPPPDISSLDNKKMEIGDETNSLKQPEATTLETSRSTQNSLINNSTKPTLEDKSQAPSSRGVDIAKSIKNLGIRLKSRQSVFVGHHLSRKKLITIVGSVVLIIIVLLGVGYLRHARQVKEQAALERLTPYQEALGNISTLGETDPVSARTQAQSQLAELGSWQAEGNLPNQAKNELERLISDTKLLYESLDVTRDLTALPLFDDLRRLSPSFLASTASGDGSRGILADRDQQLLITYTATDKSGQVIDAASLEKVIALSQIGDRSYVLGDGVWSLANQSTSDLSQVIQPGSQTEGATLIASFGSNVYVFNPSQRALYRYTASGTTFGTPTNWLTGAAPFTYTDVSSLVVDGEVWFGTNQGQVYRFVSGRQAEFAITGLDQPLSSTLYLATNPQSETMAILEPASKRLLILNKDSGLVTREFVNPNLGAATGLWLDEANNQVLVSSGTALYEIMIAV